MKSKNALRRFLTFLEDHGLQKGALTPYLALDAMFAFYREVRTKDCLDPAERDSLLFQWGTYDWGKGLSFEFSITRQFMQDMGEDDDIWHLSLTVRFAPAKKLLSLNSGYRWCTNLGELEEFQSLVAGSAAFQAVRDRTDGTVDLSFHRAN